MGFTRRALSRGISNCIFTVALFSIALAASPACADDPPAIVTSPQSHIGSIGSPATFSVVAEGTPPLSYQWRRNGALIPGANDSDYTIDPVQEETLGLYSVVISNHVGGVTSEEVTLSVASVTVFTDDFESGTLDNWIVPAGSTELTADSSFFNPNGGIYTAFLDTSLDKMHRRLEPALDGRARLTFWMFDTNQPRAYGEIRCFNGEPYGSTLIQLLANGIYNSVTMPGEKYYGTNFQGRMFAGTNAGWFLLNATNAPRRSPMWHRFEIERSADGTSVDFSVDGILGRRIFGCTPAPWDYVTIGSVGSGGTTTGYAWFDDVKVEYFDAPRINVQPLSQAANSGDSITFFVDATGDVQSYQWRFNGVAIPAGIASSLTLDNVDAANAGSYSVVILNRAGPTLSDTALLTLTDLALPVITSQPSDTNVIVGSPASLTIVASGEEPLTYTWFKITGNTTNVVTNGNHISGADTPVLNFSSTIASDSAIYRVAVSNAAATVISSNALLSVVTPPVIVAQPQSLTVLADQNATFTVTASGGGVNYQWHFEDQLIPNATNSSLTISNAQPSQSGNYSVIVSNVAGVTPSSTAALSVHYYLSALGSGGSVIKQPAELSYAPGSQVTLTAAATPNYVFQNWSGDAAGTNNPLTVTMTSHKQVWAHFSNAIPNGKVIRDGNIDPWNLGKGDWIYFISSATNKLGGNVPSVTNEHSLMLWYKKHGIRYIIVKAGDNASLFNGSYNRPQLTNTFIDIAHSHGLLVFGYNRSFGADIAAEVSIADYVFNQGADGFVFDAEAEWESGHPWITNAPMQAWHLCGTVRTNWPNKFIAYSPFAIVSIHDGPSYNFPYRQFGYWCDAAIPMIYHYNWAGRSPSGAINWTDVGWLKWQETCAHPTNNPTTFLGTTVYWTNAIKPLAPVGHVYGPNPPNSGVSELEPEDVMEWADYLSVDPHCPTPGGYKGFSFWRADLHGAAQWTNIQAATAGDFPGIVNNIVIDDFDADFTGPWDHERTFYNGVFYGAYPGDTNSFGTNYFVVGQGTGSSSAQFTPNISIAGLYDVYEWHVERPDASASVPFEITSTEGTTTLRINQQVNTGKWSLLGRFPFAAGTSGNIRITDDIPEPGTVAIADGIKLVYVPVLAIQPQSIFLPPGGGLQFDFTSVPGSVVEVQSRESLSAGDWSTITTVTNSSGTATFIDPAPAGTNRFYRLLLAP